MRVVQPFGEGQDTVTGERVHHAGVGSHRGSHARPAQNSDVGQHDKTAGSTRSIKEQLSGSESERGGDGGLEVLDGKEPGDEQAPTEGRDEQDAVYDTPGTSRKASLGFFGHVRRRIVADESVGRKQHRNQKDVGLVIETSVVGVRRKDKASRLTSGSSSQGVDQEEQETGEVQKHGSLGDAGQPLFTHRVDDSRKNVGARANNAWEPQRTGPVTDIGISDADKDGDEQADRKGSRSHGTPLANGVEPASVPGSNRTVLFTSEFS